MATFKVMSGGVAYKVTAPDMESAIEALNEVLGPAPANMAAGPVQTAETSVMGDVVKSVGSGLVSGAHSLAGLPGDVADLARGAGGWIGDRAREFAGKEPLAGPAPDPLGLSNIPGTEDLEKTTGWDKAKYVPKTTEGEFANTAASFVPGAVALGGAGSVASKAMKLGVAPGVVSEAAGQATEGTALETPARVAGALVGAGGASAAFKGKATSKAPAIATMKAEKNALYGSFDTPQGQLILEPAAFNRIANEVSQLAYKSRINNSTPKSLAILKEIENMAAPGVAPDFLEIEALRSQLGALSKSSEPAERFMAGLLKSKLTREMEGLAPADLIAGDPADALRRIGQARSLVHRAKKSEMIQDIVDQANDAVSANYTTAGFMTAVRQKFRALKRKPEFKAAFSAAEKRAVQDIISGGAPEKILRTLGRVDARSPIIGSLLLMLGTAGGSPWLAAGAAVAGAGAKAVTSRIAANKVNALDEMIRSGGASLPKPGPGLPGKGVPLGGYYLSNPGGDPRLQAPPGVVLDPLGNRIPAR